MQSHAVATNCEDALAGPAVLNSPADIDWLNQTHLRGVPLPQPWNGYRSVVMQGPSDKPQTLNLYCEEQPSVRAEFLRVRLDMDGNAGVQLARFLPQEDGTAVRVQLDG